MFEVREAQVVRDSPARPFDKNAWRRRLHNKAFEAL